MKKDKKTAHTKEELIAIFKEQNIHESVFQRFLVRYKLCFDELYEDMKNYEDDDFEEGDSIQESALYVLSLYTTPFLQLIKKGHSEEWAHLVSKNIENKEVKIYEAFEELKKEQPELAKKELLLNCNNLSSDDDFKRYYLYLFGIGEGFDNPSEKAREYAVDYKEQIKKGRSKLYAHIYADLADMDYHHIYREEYAYAYEKAINEDKSKSYARSFADEYASELVNVKIKFRRPEDEEAYDFEVERVNGHMKAWVYSSEHNLKDAGRFIKIYGDIYINTYFADNGMPNGTLEEIDKEILEKTLLQYNKL